MLTRLALLGPVSLTGPKGPLMRRASQQRRIALLSVLASSPGGSIARDRVIGLLWPERDERAARHLLADSLYILRRTLGDGAISGSSETLHLSPDLVWCDVVQLRRALAERRWADALDLYRGDFLDGFNLRNAPDFDHWAFTERGRLQASAARAASTLADSLERAGRTGEAIAAAERRLDLAAHDEAALRDLVRLHVAAGNRARAAAVARGFVERLALELGVPASRETMRLMQETRVDGCAEPIIVVTPRRPKRRGSRRIDSATSSLIARGRHHWSQRTPASLERALDYFRRVAERDDRAVGAWCGLADCWAVMGCRGYAPPADAIQHAEASAERAKMLDDSLSSVYMSIGGVNILGRRWRAAETALRHAILLDPENANAHHWLALTLLTGFGDRDAAMREQTISVQLNPVGGIQTGALGWQRYLRGEYELARLDTQPAAELNPDVEEGHAGLARVAARLGDEATMAKAISGGLARRDDLRGDLLAEHASALAVLGESRRARRLARQASAHARCRSISRSPGRRLGTLPEPFSILSATRFSSTGRRRRSGGIHASTESEMTRGSAAFARASTGYGCRRGDTPANLPQVNLRTQSPRRAEPTGSNWRTFRLGSVPTARCETSNHRTGTARTRCRAGRSLSRNRAASARA